MKKWLYAISVFFAGSPLYAPPIQAPLQIQENDGSPRCWPWRLDVSTGTLTCNADGTADLLTGGGGSGSSSLETIFGTAQSSPTATLKGQAGQFLGSVSGSTMTFSLDPSSVTLLGQNGVIRNQDTLQDGATAYTWQLAAQKNIQVVDGSFQGTNSTNGNAIYQAYPESVGETDITGYRVDDAGASGATNSYGFYANVNDATNNWAFYANSGNSFFKQTHISDGNQLRFFVPNAAQIPYVALMTSTTLTNDSNQIYVLPRATGTVDQVLSIQAVDDRAHLYWKDDASGGGSGIVSPGTFTWRNSFGVYVSTLRAGAAGQSGSPIRTNCGAVNCSAVEAHSGGTLNSGEVQYAVVAVSTGGTAGQINTALWASASGTGQTNRAVNLSAGCLAFADNCGSPGNIPRATGGSATPTWGPLSIAAGTTTISGLLPSENMVSTAAFTTSTKTWSASQLFISSIAIVSTGTTNALGITANGTHGTTAGTSGGLLVNCTGGGPASGFCSQFYSNAVAQEALGGIVNVIADNTDFNQPAIYVKQDGTSGGAASARFDGVAPQVEWVENDQTTPAGKYEDGVNGDIRYIAGRDIGDASFEIFFRAVRPDAAGGGYIAALSSIPIRLYDGDSSHFVGFVSTATLDHSTTYVVPITTAAVDTVLAINSIDANGRINTYWKTDQSGGGGGFIEPSTFTRSFPFGLSASTISVNGSGGGVVTLVEGTEPAGVAENTVVWSDSTDRWLKFIPNGTTDYQVVGSSASPAAGEIAVWSSSRSLVGKAAPVSYTGDTFKSSFSYTFRPEVARSTETTNFCSISNSTNSLTAFLACDASTREDAAWSTILDQYQGGTLNVYIKYSMGSATSGDVVFSAKIMCEDSSQDIDIDSFAAPVNGTDTVPGTAGAPGTITIALTDDSCAEGDLVVLNVAREANLAGDTATGDAEIRAIRLYE